MEIKQITFTRFIAAFTIVVFHYGQNIFPFDHGLLKHFAEEGAFMVSYFFCLSGYILTHVYYKQDHTSFDGIKFYRKRISRIYPLYLFSFLATLFAGMFFLNAYPKGGSILLQLFSLHAWFPGIVLEINYPSWSLSVELFFYLCFPFILRKFNNYSSKKILWITLSIWSISAISHVYFKHMPRNKTAWGEFILYNPLFHINAFIYGIAMCIILKRAKAIELNISKYSLLILLLTTTLLFFIISTDNPILPWIHNGLLAPIFLSIIASLHFGKNIIVNLFSSKPLIFLGEISYGIYILQFPVRIFFEHFIEKFNISANKHLLFYFYLLILILISSITFISIEQPLRKYFNQKKT